MAEWRKSSYSPTGSDCVEIAISVGIRDSKAPAVQLPVSREAWTEFLSLVTSR
jgi:hypothetical protein